MRVIALLDCYVWLFYFVVRMYQKLLQLFLMCYDALHHIPIGGCHGLQRNVYRLVEDVPRPLQAVRRYDCRAMD